MSDRRVWPSDVMALHFCCKGARLFFKQHGLSYPKFVSEGIPQQDLLDTKDGMAIMVVERVKQEVGD